MGSNLQMSRKNERGIIPPSHEPAPQKSYHNYGSGAKVHQPPSSSGSRHHLGYDPNQKQHESRNYNPNERSDNYSRDLTEKIKEAVKKDTTKPLPELTDPNWFKSSSDEEEKAINLARERRNASSYDRKLEFDRKMDELRAKKEARKRSDLIAQRLEKAPLIDVNTGELNKKGIYERKAENNTQSEDDDQEIDHQALKIAEMRKKRERMYKKLNVKKTQKIDEDKFNKAYSKYDEYDKLYGKVSSRKERDSERDRKRRKKDIMTANRYQDEEREREKREERELYEKLRKQQSEVDERKRRDRGDRGDRDRRSERDRERDRRSDRDRIDRDR